MLQIDSLVAFGQRSLLVTYGLLSRVCGVGDAHANEQPMHQIEHANPFGKEAPFNPGESGEFPNLPPPSVFKDAGVTRALPSLAHLHSRNVPTRLNFGRLSAFTSAAV
jgi:hypothetical protein